METITVILNVRTDRIDEFVDGFRMHEVPVWQELAGRGSLVRASLSRLDISSRPVAGSTQFMVVAVFATGEGHHEHDNHPGFQAWNAIADQYQVGEPLAFGGETDVAIGD
ncbi:MAG: hypothetical protein ACJ767_01045 [Chloroflexota bacterium]